MMEPCVPGPACKLYKVEGGGWVAAVVRSRAVDSCARRRSDPWWVGQGVEPSANVDRSRATATARGRPTGIYGVARFRSRRSRRF